MARSKRGRRITWQYGFPYDLAKRKEKIIKDLEKDKKEPPWCIKRLKFRIVKTGELKDIGQLEFRMEKGRWCAYIVKETFAGYLDENEVKNDEEALTFGFTFSGNQGEGEIR